MSDVKRKRPFKRKSYLPFLKAREYVNRLNLKNYREWVKFCKGQLIYTRGKKPSSIPANPHRTYIHDGWKGYGDWLGTDRKQYTVKPRSFGAARKCAQRLRITSVRQWQKFCRGQMGIRPPLDLPLCPDRVYRDKGWQSWDHFLCKPAEKKNKIIFRPFELAKTFVSLLQLKNKREWRKFCRGRLLGKGFLPKDIPMHPDIVYRRSGWSSWEDWLGIKCDDTHIICRCF